MNTIMAEVLDLPVGHKFSSFDEFEVILYFNVPNSLVQLQQITVSIKYVAYLLKCE